WLFKENGCTLEGLTEVYDGFEDFTTGKKTKIPAYLFKVNYAKKSRKALLKCFIFSTGGF
ncbi:MAG: hypothetical protein IKE05_00570, partial [Clostridia bacterium]|nr:hypothetical protein [Clostridia bacterium]